MKLDIFFPPNVLSNNAGSDMLATYEPYTKPQAHHKVSLYLSSRAYESGGLGLNTLWGILFCVPCP